MKFQCLILLVYTFFFVEAACAQNDSINNRSFSVADISSNVLSGLQKEYTVLQSKLNKQSEKLLFKLQQKENGLKAKLSKTDSAKAADLFTDDVKQRYTALKNGLYKASDKLRRFPLKEYIPGIDSVQTSFSFLMEKTQLLPNQFQKLQTANAKLKDLQTELQKANDIQMFISERAAALKEQLMNSSLTKKLTAINKQVYYYQAQLQKYKDLLNDKEKLKEKLLETVRTLPAFQKFWQKNSYLAALFPMPDDNTTTQFVSGLQTRAGVQSRIAQRAGSSLPQGTNAQQYFQAQIDAAQTALNQLKNKLNQYANGNGDMTMPVFNPNTQKTKSFFERLEYGFNIQSESGRYSLPATSDIALTVGYKISDNKRLGIGASYKVGWGHGFRDIHISSEGIGFRSYADIKAKGSLWLSGGFEYSYLSSFRSLRDLHDNIDIWQRSALLGVSKKYKIGKKEGNMQLLYDFLHSQQTPPGTALKFRVGYNF